MVEVYTLASSVSIWMSSEVVQELIQVSRKRKCAGCGRDIVKGEYALVEKRKAYCLECASKRVIDPSLKERIDLLLREKIDSYIA